jgi:N-acetylmuramoyl-L-alanine amidase
MATFKMKYEIVPRYLTGPSQRRPQTPLQACRFMVAHDTGNPGSTAQGNVAYFENSRNDMSASAHIFVDDKQILECIPFLTGPPEKALHVVYNVTTDNSLYGADANDAAGGVELCYGGSINFEEAYMRFVWVIAYSCFKYSLDPATDITGHHILDPQRRTDPVNAFSLNSKTFTEFIADVGSEYDECLEEEDEDKMPMKFENDWQWTMLGDALDGLYKQGLLRDYTWAEKAYTRQLTTTELAWLNTIIFARQNDVEV